MGPTTLRLRAVRIVLAPAATGCYKFSFFVHLARHLLPPNCYLYTPNYALF
jgi:hypothetical protein